MSSFRQADESALSKKLPQENPKSDNGDKSVFITLRIILFI